jgi:hypothetical protein
MYAGDCDNSQNDPLVTVVGLDKKSYTVRVVQSTNSEHAKTSNVVRQQLIDGKEKTGQVRVMIIKNNGSNDRYLAVGVPTKVPVKRYTQDKPEFDIKVDEARQVLTGKNIYLARCMFLSKSGNPTIRMYGFDVKKSIRLFGFMQTSEGSRSRRPLGRDITQLYADLEISASIIYGSKHRKAIAPGDYTIVRLQGKNPKGNITFAEPVINIMPEDEAFSPTGESIHTIVEGYKPGDLIHNIPITGSRTQDNEFAGLGNVKRQDGQEGFFYKTIIVADAARDKGKIVSLARIVSDDESVIFAEKVE